MTATYTVERPNGRIYRRRKPPVAQTYVDDMGLVAGVAVLRTHDPLEAIRVAGSWLRDLESDWDFDPVAPDDGILGWVRLTPFDSSGCSDRSFVDDPVRGVPAVFFDGESIERGRRQSAHA